MVALNEPQKQILFCECKWQDRVDADKVLASLRETAAHVLWYKDVRKEFYAIFTKNFRKKVKGKGIYCFDLRDIEKSLK
ncbi:MAG: hypothetical protein ACPLYW_03025 [Candidatus Nanoarchaeia archaeon]